MRNIKSAYPSIIRSEISYANDAIKIAGRNIKKKEQGLIKILCLSLKHDLVKKNSLKQLFNFREYNINKISTVYNLYTNEALKNVILVCKKKNLKYMEECH